MSELTDSIKNGLSNVLPELGQTLKDAANDEIVEACNIERQNNIALAAVAMLDAGLSDSVVTHELQKYWDLRLSETKDYIDWAYKKLDKSL